MKVSSVVLNTFTSDNRVLKENLTYKNAGFETKIIAMHEGDLLEEEVIEGIPVKRIKLRTKNWPKSFIFSAFKYFEFVYKAIKLTKGSDLVHANDLDTLIVGYFRKKLSKKTRLLYDAHEYEIERTSTAHPSRKWLSLKMEKWFIKSCDVVVTVSESIADEYVRLYGIKKPELIYNCPNYKPIYKEKNNLFRAKFNISSDQKIFIYQGGFTRGRGVNQIIDAFSELPDDFVVVFMGYGPFESIVKKACEKHSNIFYHPAVPMNEINKYTNSADFGLLTIENVSKSYYYSLPNKLFEYAMANIPIIAFPTLEIKNKISNYNLGFVSSSETSDALVNTIKSLSFDDYKKHSLNLEDFAKEFNWENQEKTLLEIVNNICR